MDLTHQFTVPTSVEETWAHFQDIASVAECFPGAQVTSADADSFSGTVKVKLGPIALVYAGSGTFVEKDEAAHRFVVDAKGKDKRGNGTAGAKVTLAMATGASGGTDVAVVTDLAITGKPAQFGRGVMQDVSDKLLGQFVACLEQRLGSSAEPAPGPRSRPARSRWPRPRTRLPSRPPRTPLPRRCPRPARGRPPALGGRRTAGAGLATCGGHPRGRPAGQGRRRDQPRLDGAADPVQELLEAGAGRARGHCRDRGPDRGALTGGSPRSGTAPHRCGQNDNLLHCRGRRGPMWTRRRCAPLFRRSGANLLHKRGSLALRPETAPLFGVLSAKLLHCRCPSRFRGPERVSRHLTRSPVW